MDEFCRRNSYFFSSVNDYSNIDNAKVTVGTGSTDKSLLINGLSDISEDSWSKDSLSTLLLKTCESISLKMKDLESGNTNETALRESKREIQLFLRAAIAKGRHGPSIVSTMEILGREACLKRLSAYNANGNMALR